jgi:hypothetical protein
MSDNRHLAPDSEEVLKHAVELLGKSVAAQGDEGGVEGA